MSRYLPRPRRTIGAGAHVPRRRPRAITRSNRYSPSCARHDSTELDSLGQRLNILHVITQGDEIGGAQVHLAALAAAQLESGHHVAAVMGSFGYLDRELRRAGVQVFLLPSLRRSVGPQDVLGLFALTRLIARHNPDIVALHSSKAGVLGRVACLVAGVPAVFTAHGLAISKGLPALNRILGWAAELLLRPATDMILTVSSVDLRAIRRYRMARADRSRWIPNGLPDVSQPPLLGPRSPAVPTIISVARFAPPKDFLTLVRALALIRDLRWRALFVGDGPLRPQCEAVAESLDLLDRIDFLGRREDVPQLLASSDIFVLSSRSEGMPISVLEAMRAGLPVLASRVGGTQDLLAGLGYSALFTPGDANELARRLRDLLVQPDRILEASKRARRSFEDNHTFDQMLSSTVAAYRYAIAHPTAPKRWRRRSRTSSL